MNATFGTDQILFLVGRARWTIVLTVLSLLRRRRLVGFVVALAARSRHAPCALRGVGYIGLIQGTPLLMLLFLSFFGLPLIGLRPAAAGRRVGLAGALRQRLPRPRSGAAPSSPSPSQQWEAAAALAPDAGAAAPLRDPAPGASASRTPPTVGFVVQIIKNTSLASIVGFVELARAGQLVNNATYEPFRVYVIVALIYFAICFPLTRLAGSARKGSSMSGRRH